VKLSWNSRDTLGTLPLDNAKLRSLVCPRWRPFTLFTGFTPAVLPLPHDDRGLLLGNCIIMIKNS
jgi:hypothetical protein